MVHEAEEQLRFAKHSVESRSQGISDLTEIISRLVGKVLPFMLPQRDSTGFRSGAYSGSLSTRSRHCRWYPDVV